MIAYPLKWIIKIANLIEFQAIMYFWNLIWWRTFGLTNMFVILWWIWIVLVLDTGQIDPFRGSRHLSFLETLRRKRVRHRSLISPMFKCNHRFTGEIKQCMLSEIVSWWSYQIKFSALKHFKAFLKSDWRNRWRIDLVILLHRRAIRLGNCSNWFL